MNKEEFKELTEINRIEKQALDTDFHPFYKSKPKEKTKVIPISSIKKD